MIVSSTAYILIILGPSTTGTMPLTTQNLRTAIKWRVSPQIIKQVVMDGTLGPIFKPGKN